jgi:hypothetical protein
MIQTPATEWRGGSNLNGFQDGQRARGLVWKNAVSNGEIAPTGKEV